jgi:EcoRII C terminal
MMRRGLLSEYFVGVAVKRLSAVEADTRRSNQHEFNGVNQLKKILGPGRTRFKARFVWLGDEQEAVAEDGFLTWYDARENHPTRSEYRLYFPASAVSGLAQEGDALFIARRTDESVMVIVTPAKSTIQSQLLWLFDLPDQPALSFAAQEIPQDTSGQLDFAVRYIFDELGIEPEEPEAGLLDALIEPYGVRFPTTREFSGLARNSLPHVSAADDPDAALLAWIEREELLFRRLERRVVAERIRTGFAAGETTDVEGFLSFSLSVQNRRKARAGSALENHLEALFADCHVRFVRGAETENRNKPDFLFPGAAEYHDASFPTARLTMLGAKSTLKDRWRQVLAEAERIREKHLLTLEPGISENQTEQMRTNMLHLVIPRALHQTFRASQQDWLLSITDFVSLVRDREIGDSHVR